MVFSSATAVNVQKVKDDGNIHIMTLELQGLPPNVDEGFVKKHLFQG